MNKLFHLKCMMFFSSLVFFAPVSLLLRTSKGITLNEFFMLQAILSFGILILEVPTGFVADRLGYKKTMVLSKILLFITRILFLIANNFIIFIIEALVEAFAICFDSGTSDAYIYTLIGEKEYEVQNAKIQNFATLGFITSTCLFPLLYHFFELQGLIIITAFTSFISIYFTLCIRSVPMKPKKLNKRLSLHLKNSKTILLIILNNSMITLSFLIVNFFYVSKIEEIGLSVEFLGVIILGYSIIQLISPLIISKWSSLQNNHKLILCTTISFFLFGLVHILSGLLVLLPMIIIPTILNIYGISLDNMNNGYIDEIKQENQRAAYLSMFSMGSAVIEIVFLLTSSVLNNTPPFLIIALCLLLTTAFNYSSSIN